MDETTRWLVVYYAVAIPVWVVGSVFFGVVVWRVWRALGRK